MTELEKLSLSQPLTDVYNAMEQDIMLAIAKQLAKDGSISASSEWRLQRLAEAGDLNKTVIGIIASYTGIQSDLLTETLLGAANSVIDKLEPGFRELAKQGFISDTPVPASKSVNRAIQTFHKQAASDLNLVNTVMRYKAKQAYVDLVNKTFDAVNAIEDVSNRQELLNTLGKHTMSTVMGAESRSEAVRKCIREFNSKGIPAFVDAAGREWSPEAYINMDIRTTVSNTANAAQDARCDDYGIDLIAVSSHPGARPKCAPYQGRIFSRSNKSGIAHDGNGKEIHYEPLSSTSYGEPDGLFGINCRHKKYPFIDGVNFQRYFPYDKEENDKRYKEIQEQRRLERKVRNTKREADMPNEVGDREAATAARAKLKEQRKAYRTYCDEHELTQRNDRLTVSKGSVSAAKTQKPLDNGGGSGIIKESGKNPITQITDKAIERVPVVKISGYTDEQSIFIQQQHKNLLAYSRDNNEHKEIAFVFTNNFGDRKEFIGTDDKLDFGNSLYGTDLFVMHNHPRNSSYSFNDIIEFVANDSIKTLSIVKNNGTVEVLTKLSSYDKLNVLTELSRLEKNNVKVGSDEEYRKIINKFLNKYNDGGIFEWTK